MKLRYMNESNLPDNVSPLDKHFYPDEPKFDPDNVSYAKVSYRGCSADDTPGGFDETVEVYPNDVKAFNFVDYMTDKQNAMEVIEKILIDDGIIPVWINEIVFVDRDGEKFVVDDNGEVSLYKW